MSFTAKQLYRVAFTFMLFVSIDLCYSLATSSPFRPSDIEIKPTLVVINSTSSVDFVCNSHRSNAAPIEVNLSKIIPSNQIKILTTVLNETTIHIHLQSINYVGIFHLLCYSDGDRTEGIRADVIVKAAPGVLQLAERCRVYDRQYIKCIIRAPTIATAIQNDYPAKFDFEEINYASDYPAYISRVDFLKNESTNEYLVFKWKPTVDGHFPNGLRMHMKAILSHFDPSSYYFDMTPIFRINPKFTLQVMSSDEIRINISPTIPAAFCEKSILHKLATNINQTWTPIEADRSVISIDNLVSDSIYRICVKCRQVYTDPDDSEECQEIRTLNKFNFLFNQKVLFFTVILVLILLVVIGFVVCFWQNRRKRPYQPVKNENQRYSNRRNPNFYEQVSRSDRRSSDSIHTVTPIEVPVNDNPDDVSSIEDNNTSYLPIASITEIISMNSPPQVLYSSET